MEYFKPYEGEQPYIFISYAHRDSDAVMKVVSDMHDRGYRLWYDEGIEVGSEWPECIAEHLTKANLIIAFVSNAYMASDNCRREMHYSLSKRKKIINVFLEDTQMTPGMEMQIGNIFALMKQFMSEEEFYRKLYGAPLLNSEDFTAVQGETETRPAAAKNRAKAELEHRKAELELRRTEMKLQKEEARLKRRRNRKRRLTVFFIILFLLLAGIVALGIVGYATGWAERLLIKPVVVSALPNDTEAQFTEPVFENAARKFTGISEGAIKVSDLAGLTKLYIYGDNYYFSPEDGPASAAAEGTLKDLSDLKYFTHLDVLYIADEPLSSVDSIPACDIEELSLINCKVSSLEGISDLPRLRTLVTDGCPVTDLGDINRCLSLKKLSLIGSDIPDYTTLKPLVKLAEFATSSSAIDEMYTVCHIGSLTSVSLYDCDLRGAFFRAYDRERGLVSLKLINCQLDSTANVEDFSGLTELTLRNTGANLDWSGLTELSALRTVYVSADMQQSMEAALRGSGAQVMVIER